MDEDAAEEALDAERYADLGRSADSDSVADGAAEEVTREPTAAGECPHCLRSSRACEPESAADVAALPVSLSAL